MNKKLLSLSLAAASIFSLTGCNYQMLDFNYKYDTVHIYETGKCYDIDMWTDYDGEQLQIKFSEGDIILISSMDCMLVKGDCPICDA